MAVSPHLFTNATADVDFPDGTSPDPLFEYWLTEDLDGNHVLADSECVVDPCPPTSPRKPKLYLWGDTDFDDQLSEGEKDLIRDQPVGSPLWAGNRMAESGALKSSTLTAAVDPANSDSYVLKVADASKFGGGLYVQVGSGATAETSLIESVKPSASTVSLVSNPAKPHGVGATVTVLPQTLLRAVRAIKINYDAITPEKDVEAGVAQPGRMGHAGTRGLDYRVKAYEKTVELVNLQTVPLFGRRADPPPVCPLTVTGDCAGDPVSAVRAFTTGSTPVTLPFLIRGLADVPMPGVPVDFTQSNGSIGNFGVPGVKSDLTGLAAVSYSASGTVGDSVVTATATCVNAASKLEKFTGTLTVKATSGLGGR